MNAVHLVGTLRHWKIVDEELVAWVRVQGESYPVHCTWAVRELIETELVSGTPVEVDGRVFWHHSQNEHGTKIARLSIMASRLLPIENYA